MKYNRTVVLGNGEKLILRSGEPGDAQELLAVFNRTHEETDFMLTYADENSFTVEQEENFLRERLNSPNEIEILAVLGGKVVGSAGIESLGSKEKIRHRAEFGIGILKDCWGLGIGRALTEACIECAREAGYSQLELEVAAENGRAVSLYERAGFTEFGRNPLGFIKRGGEAQSLILMRLEL